MKRNRAAQHPMTALSPIRIKRAKNDCTTSKYFPFRRLAMEIRCKVFSFLEMRDLLSAAVVNREWNYLANDESLWGQLAKDMIELDDVRLLPATSGSWKRYCLQMDLSNAIRKRGVELLNHVLLVFPPRWKKIDLRFVDVDGKRDLVYRIFQEEQSEAHDISEKDHSEASIALGVQEETRSLFWTEIYEELCELFQMAKLQWNGSLMRLSRLQSRMDQEVDLAFFNCKTSSFSSEEDISYDDEETPLIYQIKIYPKFCTTNALILQRMLTHAPYLLPVKSSSSEMFEELLFPNDPMNEELSQQVVGIYSKEFCTWTWPWNSQNFTSSQYHRMVELKRDSVQKGWPEANLFKAESIDCESNFALAIARLCALRIPNAFSIQKIKWEKKKFVFMVFEKVSKLNSCPTASANPVLKV